MMVQGWASTPDLDSAKTIIATGAFDASIAARGLSGIRMLLDHDPALPAGVITKLETRDSKLWIEARLDLALPGVAERARLILRQKSHGFSVGARKQRWSRRDEHLLITHADLYEITLTPHPRNDACRLVFAEPPKRLWPDDLQRTYDELDEAIARTPRRTLTPTFLYGDAT